MGDKRKKRNCKRIVKEKLGKPENQGFPNNYVL